MARNRSTDVRTPSPALENLLPRDFAKLLVKKKREKLLHASLTTKSLPPCPPPSRWPPPSRCRPLPRLPIPRLGLAPPAPWRRCSLRSPPRYLAFAATQGGGLLWSSLILIRSPFLRPADSQPEEPVRKEARALALGLFPCDKGGIFLLTLSNFPIGVVPTRKLLHRQENSSTDRKILFSVAFVLSVYQQRN